MENDWCCGKYLIFHYNKIQVQILKNKYLFLRHLIPSSITILLFIDDLISHFMPLMSTFPSSTSNLLKEVEEEEEEEGFLKSVSSCTRDILLVSGRTRKTRMEASKAVMALIQ